MRRNSKTHGESFYGLTSPPSKARMKAQLSLVQERTVSVLPSLKRRVIADSYVKLNLFWSCNQKIFKKMHAKEINTTTENFLLLQDAFLNIQAQSE